MLIERLDCDSIVVVGSTLVFGLPLTLLLPNFSIWNLIPKVHFERLHIFEKELTWLQTNTVLITLLAFFFCFFLEMRKRKLDDLVENVLCLSQTADETTDVEQSRQAAAVRVCTKLLDASTEHYENLILLRDELRKRQNLKNQFPPVIELSSSNMT